MKKRTLSWLLVLALLLSLSAFAAAETPTNAARNGVVRLVEAFLSDGEVDSVNLSTAFFVGKEGDPVQYLVTNYHCVSEYLQNGKGTVGNEKEFKMQDFMDRDVNVGFSGGEI